jgi:hypothetical protein
MCFCCGKELLFYRLKINIMMTVNVFAFIFEHLTRVWTVVISWLIFKGCLVLNVVSVVVILSWMCCPGCPFLAVLSCISGPGCHVWVSSWLSCSYFSLFYCPALAVLSWLSCLGCPGLLSRLACPIRADNTVLSLLCKYYGCLSMSYSGYTVT